MSFLDRFKDKIMENVFITTDYWNKLGIPDSKRVALFENVFGKSSFVEEDREKSIKFLVEVLDRIQDNLVSEINNGNSLRMTIELCKIYDKNFKHYIWDKEDREKLVDKKVTDTKVQEIYGINRNIALDILYGLNIWIENGILLQHDLEEKYIVDPVEINPEICLYVYMYGLVSRSLSFLTLSKKLEKYKLYYGIEVNPQKTLPINVLRNHPVLYYNPLLTGNQRVFSNLDEDICEINYSDFGKGFIEEYGIGLYEFIVISKSLIKYQFADGKYAVAIIGRDKFCKHVDEIININNYGEKYLKAFSINSNLLRRYINEQNSIIWKAGVNKYRFELRPIIELDNGDILLTCQALEQSIQIWYSMYYNGGVAYSDVKDKFTKAQEQRNQVLSDRLVDEIIKILQNKYDDGQWHKDVNYDRVYPKNNEYNYGDYDVVFYSQNANELFLIESKYFSDSLSNSGHINDYIKMYKNKGYYEHCRKRCDLVMNNPDEMKDFMGIKGNVKVHFLFVTSKPIELEFQDEDCVVTIVPLGIFKEYLDDNILSEDGLRYVRPTIDL